MSPMKLNDGTFALVIKSGKSEVGWFCSTNQRLDESEVYLAIFLLSHATRASYQALMLFHRRMTAVYYV